MVGRTALLQRVWADLTKATPSNLIIVGPRAIGKSVFLNTLGTKAREQGSPYSLVLKWELGHAPPRSDELFVAKLSEQLRQAMGVAPQYSEHRDYLRDDKYGSMKEVLDLLDGEGQRVLMIWDGLDKALSQGELTGHLFGQMRDLFHGKRHKIVTATRSSPTELARNRQVYDSEFWNLFDITPVRIGPFDAVDREAALNRAKLTLSSGGIRELQNWSGGHPVFLLSVLNRLVADGPQGQIDNEAVTSAARTAAEDITEKVATLWEQDCTAGAREIYRLLDERTELPASDFSQDDIHCLVSRGFAFRAGNKIKLSCRMLQQHAKASFLDAGTMARLFGRWDVYRASIRTVLELRLGHIRVVSKRLTRLVGRAIEDISESPDDCLNSLTSIEDEALDLIWTHEFGAAMTIPHPIVAYWTQRPRDKNQIISDMMSMNDWRLPNERHRQVRLLQLLTGSLKDFDPKAKSISKDTYILINAIHGYRNRNQHADGQQMHAGVAVAAVMTCLELLDALNRELP